MFAVMLSYCGSGLSAFIQDLARTAQDIKQIEVFHSVLV